MVERENTYEAKTRFEATELRAEIDRIRTRLAAAEGLLGRIDTFLDSDRFRPAGHSGDEESGRCYEDCERCEWDAMRAMVADHMHGG